MLFKTDKKGIRRIGEVGTSFTYDEMILMTI